MPLPAPVTKTERLRQKLAEGRLNMIDPFSGEVVHTVLTEQDTGKRIFGHARIKIGQLKDCREFFSVCHGSSMLG
jgi:hypothetical protein